MLLIAIVGKSQLLSWSPQFIQESSSTVDIICDATLGNKGIKDYLPTTDIYVHIGVITTASTSSSDWKGSKFTWGSTTATANATYMGSNKWKFTITGGLRTYFGITNPSEKILRIAVLFRNGAGAKVLRNADASDMYVPVYDNGLYTRIDNPLRTPFYKLGTETITKAVNDNVAITTTASASSTMKIYFNGTQVNPTTTGVTQATANPQITAVGVQTIVSEVTDGTNTATDTVKFLVAGNVNIAALPTGVKDGINYEIDPTAVTLVLYAPGKTTISVLGDFNNWTETLIHQMNRTPDGKYFWLRITGLTSAQEYAYQYLIDGTLKVADYNAEKILDPWNDQYIPVSTYPNLKPYPTGLTSGVVSVFQTNKTPYTWLYTLTRPNKKNLMIYELLVRDFVTNKDYQTIKDSIQYLKNLGVNTIQLMPIMEFEGNNSWGYNPAYFFAPDKYYGTETALKQLIDECHKNGIAVVLDIALNHAFGSCPMVQMYWDGVNNKPATNSPWFNPDAKHPFNVGYDFNHESQATKDFVDRVLTHWLTNYKVDGFRWDLSKGFTQTNSGSDVGFWGNYDAVRVATWKRIYNKMQAVSPNSYCILEHFAADNEEIELSNYGMLLWGNSNHNFNQASMGYSTDWDFGRAIHTNRGWTTPHLISYAESHDEERLMYKNINNGNANGSYNIKDTTTALRRQEMVAAFLTMIPGPKMIWQMGELGYDYSINTCTNLTVNSNCRLDEKPIRWDYRNKASRNNLYNVYSKLFAIRNSSLYNSAFISGAVSSNLSSAIKQITVGDANLKIVVVGNFGTSTTPASVSFPNTGTWYSYLTGTTINVTGTTSSILFQPGDYYVYTSKNLSSLLSIANDPINPIINPINTINLLVKPNPINTSSVIEYELPQYGKLNMNIVDINGRVISNLFDGYRTKGKYQFNINEALKSNVIGKGIYLLQFDFNGKRQIEKLVIAN
jgi:glycosidase